ncbi:hypothetical protein PAUR_a4422 [Pseudoalteromonas aurantia 208]|uniref:Orphan protein n=1 Tax=Pseudoalteromonas aurantia 208 TaxID=1314867 RepID=A0ABR9EFT4_9GAMM|nr:hypothetical protein [Pseudoalteromonas aurantia 208]
MFFTSEFDKKSIKKGEFALFLSFLLLQQMLFVDSSNFAH